MWEAYYSAEAAGLSKAVKYAIIDVMVIMDKEEEKKLEKKDKIEKAKKLYLKAYKKLEKAYAKDKKNADILNYLGYTLRKTGDMEQAKI